MKTKLRFSGRCWQFGSLTRDSAFSLGLFIFSAPKRSSAANFCSDRIETHKDVVAFAANEI